MGGNLDHSVPTVDKPNGVVVPRRLGQPLITFVGALRTEFGFGVMNPANTIRELAEAFAALPWDAREQDMVNLAIQFDPRINSGQFLDAALWPLLPRDTAAKSAGIVHFHYNRVVTSPTPLFASGDLEFIDGAGVRYTGTADLNPPNAILDLVAQTATLSETIGSANTKIAQKVRILDTQFPQSVRFRLGSIVSGTPLLNVRIETDSAGSPSGVLADANLTVSNVTVVGGGNTDVVFTKGAIVATGDYWVVATVSGGTMKFDGGTGGTLDQAKFYNGAWALCSAVENLDLTLYNGGLFQVACTQLTKAGNIIPGSIGAFRANNTGALTLFNLIVGTSFENLQNFQGGKDAETDALLRGRARSNQASRGTTSSPGVVRGLTDGMTPGITFVDILENDSMVWGTQETVINNSAKTGTASDLVDGATYTKIAQRFTLTKFGSASAFALKLNVDTASTMTVGIYANSAGSPGAALYSTNLQVTGVVPGGTARVAVSFATGDYLAAGTYWLVLTRTAGSFRVDGVTGEGTNNVKRYTGSAWQASSAVTSLAVEVYGGVPPKAFEAFIDGTASDNALAQAIYDLKAPTITTYGPETGTALDAANRSVTMHFAHPTNDPIVLNVVAQVTSAFTGTADDLRNLLTDYVASLGIGKTFVRQEAMSRLLTGDARTTGVFDVTTFYCGVKASFATPAALTSAQVVNLTTSFGHRFVVSLAAVDIAVTLVLVAG